MVRKPWRKNREILDVCNISDEDIVQGILTLWTHRPNLRCVRFVELLSKGDPLIVC